MRIVMWASGLIGMTIGGLLFGRMHAQVNKLLPPEKRIPLIETRMRFYDIKHLHEELFPTSPIRAAWLVLTVASASMLAIGVILAVKPK